MKLSLHVVKHFYLVVSGSMKLEATFEHQTRGEATLSVSEATSGGGIVASAWICL